MRAQDSHRWVSGARVLNQDGEHHSVEWALRLAASVLVDWALSDPFPQEVFRVSTHFFSVPFPFQRGYQSHPAQLS